MNHGYHSLIEVSLAELRETMITLKNLFIYYYLAVHGLKERNNVDYSCLNMEQNVFKLDKSILSSGHTESNRMTPFTGDRRQWSVNIQHSSVLAHMSTHAAYTQSLAHAQSISPLIIS